MMSTDVRTILSWQGSISNKNVKKLAVIKLVNALQTHRIWRLESKSVFSNESETKRVGKKRQPKFIKIKILLTVAVVVSLRSFSQLM